jgi:hypothetical protein
MKIKFFRVLFFDVYEENDFTFYLIFFSLLNLKLKTNYVYLVYNKDFVVKGVFNSRILAENFINENKEKKLEQIINLYLTFHMEKKDYEQKSIFIGNGIRGL